MYATSSQSEQAIRYDNQKYDHYKKQQDPKPDLNSTQLLSDLAVILRDVGVPEPTALSQGPNFVSENTSQSNLSLENHNSSENSSVNLHRWFDEFNQHPEKGVSKYRDTGSPYFLQQNSTSSLRDTSDIAQLPDLGYNRRDGSTDDYRSVIDDLTIENKRLRKKLRRYKNQSNKHLDKDKLFEIKIHDLPHEKRRELENALRSFASSIDYSGCQRQDSIATSINQSFSPDKATRSSKKKLSSIGTVNSRLEQSSYDSMVTSTLPTTINSELFTLRTVKSANSNSSGSNSYLKPPDNQQGLLLKNGLGDMSDRQKKKLVVQRLEQIFTGEKGVIMGASNQSLNQEEISKSTQENETITSFGGIREAHMIPQETYGNSRPNSSLVDSEVKPASESSDETNSYGSFSNQRPTRPLELDPDRTQIPSDNVEYFRHLGLSTPQLVSEEPEDATKEEGGWVYLNLLINMAQLHIINVTPDFVRSAVIDVSEKFQLSKDGQMIRWKGGIKGTHLCSDNASCSSKDRDSPNKSGKNVYKPKGKEKVTAHRLKSSAPMMSQPSSSSFHYKPLFIHRSSSENTSESGESLSGPSRTDESISSQNPWNQSRNNHQQSCGSRKKQHEDGSLVFYRGVDFCVDLCGDPEPALLQLSNANLAEMDRERNSCSPQSPIIERTISGSLLPYRPFKKPSQSESDCIEKSEQSPNIPEDISDCQLDIGAFPTDSKQGPIPLQPFESYGIGGSQISDHFEMRVLTHYSKSDTTTLRQRPAKNMNTRRRNKYIPKQLLKGLEIQNDDSHHNNDPSNPMDIKSLSSKSSCQENSLHSHLPVQSKIISSEIIHLPPSKYPSPSTLLYSSDSDVEMDGMT